MIVNNLLLKLKYLIPVSSQSSLLPVFVKAYYGIEIISVPVPPRYIYRYRFSYSNARQRPYVGTYDPYVRTRSFVIHDTNGICRLRLKLSEIVGERCRQKFVMKLSFDLYLSLVRILTKADKVD